MMHNKPYPLYDRENLYDLKAIVHHSAKTNPDGEAFRYTESGADITITYKQFKEDIDALGTAFYSLGLRGGSHIAILGENSYRWIVTAFAVMNGSNVMVPIDRDLPPDTVKSLFLKADCNVLVYSDSYHDVIEQIKDALDGVTFINMKRSYPGILTLDDLSSKGRELIASGDTAFIDNEIENTALAAIFFTSGTTGANKSVMLTHRSVAVNAIDAAKYVDPTGKVNILLLPLHHSFGFTAAIVDMLIIQSCICINRSLKYIADDLMKYKPTHLFLVPLFVETFVKKIADGAEKAGKAKLLGLMIKVSGFLLALGIDLRQKLFASVLKPFGGSLRMIICGGAFLEDRYIKYLRALGIDVLNGYGITECSPIVTINRNRHQRDESIGLLMPSCEMKIDDADGSGIGEMQVKGDYVMLGYYKDEQATKEVFEDGWFKTGDIGRIDKDGFVYITGRIKNIIVLANGQNVHPEELESSLSNIPLIREVIVREGPAENGGANIIIAEIFPDYDTAKAQGTDNLQEHFDQAVISYNKTVPAYKHIQRVIIRDTEFPKTTTKKIIRNVRVSYAGESCSNTVYGGRNESGYRK